MCASRPGNTTGFDDELIAKVSSHERHRSCEASLTPNLPRAKAESEGRSAGLGPIGPKGGPDGSSEDARLLTGLIRDGDSHDAEGRAECTTEQSESS